MKTSQIAAKRAELDAEAEQIDKALTVAVESKNYDELDALTKRVDALAGARKNLDFEEQRCAADPRAAALKGFGYDDTDQPVSVSTTTDKRLSFKGMADKIVAKIATGDLGAKSLATTGAAVVEQGFQPDPVALGQPALTMLDVLATRPHATESFAYLRQSVRTNNAAVVADGAVKPTSVYSVVRIEDTLDVVAHLSEGIPRYWLSDNASLTAFLDQELRYGLSRAVEAMVLSDIDATSGIQTQAFATNIWTTLRKSLTLLENTGYTPAFIVLNPSDFETVELAVSSVNAIEHVGLPYDPAARRLYGVPIVATVSQAAATSHVVARGAVELATDSLGVQVTWSETSNADDWSKNLIRARCESRYATTTYAPLGVVKATLA